MKRVPLSEAPVALRRPQPKPGVTNGAQVMSPFLSTRATGTPALSERAVTLLFVPVPSSGFAQPKSPRPLMVNRLAFFPSPSAQAPMFDSPFKPSIMLPFEP